jgi:peptidoglycan/xylan/chitin deacetylase (PgdA/CDA1 family)
MKVTLTFDNGPTQGVTETVLDLLKERGVRATFFVVGNQLAKPGARAIAERAAAEGHWIGNHTLTHQIVFGEDRSPEAAAHEIGETQKSLGALSHPDRFFRPAGRGKFGDHLLSPSAVDYLCAGRFTCVLWTSVPRDWEADAEWVDRCMADVRSRDWSVVVVHDLPTGAMRDLPRLLDRLQEEGAELVQDFPADCIPIRRGEIVSRLDHVMRAA